jgi:hypothetical protein
MSSRKIVNHAGKKAPVIKEKKKTEFFSEELTSLDFSDIKRRAEKFADHLDANFEKVADILLEYESFEVVKDEFDRTIDHLRSLEENKNYFSLRIGQVTAFLPRNQPLYALACFVLIPSFMASEVHFRIPHSMRQFFPALLKLTKIKDFFPNVFVSTKERLEFLKERSALRIDPKTEESLPVTDVVIFTGTSHHAEKLRLVFDRRTLFITNGSGHNPVVISKDAKLPDALKAVLSLQLYNQGQDCANPNAILVHRSVFKPFIQMLRKELGKVRVGHYRDRNCRVGPISEPEDLSRIQTLLVNNREWLDPSTPGTIRTSEVIVEPTIVCKPLADGGNFTEVFAPIIFVQQFDKDADLSAYFEHHHYAKNAMYVTLYGKSAYIENLIGKEINGKILHDKRSFLHNTHLHAHGMERGTQPYGGNGYGASNLSINGQIICKATLPQRDIFEQIAKPLMDPARQQSRKDARSRMTGNLIKDVQKLLSLKTTESSERKEFSSYKNYIDTNDVKAGERRYFEISPERIFGLLDHPNVKHIATMEPKEVRHIRALRKYLNQTSKINNEDLGQFLYTIPKETGVSDEQNKIRQLEFFKDVYQLLLGKDAGPRLAYFLCDADREKILYLLNI